MCLKFIAFSVLDELFIQCTEALNRCTERKTSVFSFEVLSVKNKRKINAQVDRDTKCDCCSLHRVVYVLKFMCERVKSRTLLLNRVFFWPFFPRFGTDINN